jgi:CelD/BcsL family acetyltransferase involved in cellulose biosynthesis
VRRVRIIERAEEMRKIEALWTELHVSQHDCTVFQRLELNEIVARVFAYRERPYVVLAESDSGAAIIPACILHEHVSFLGEELFDYRAPLANDLDLLDCAWCVIDRLSLPVKVKATRGTVHWGEMQRFSGAPWLPASQILPRQKKHERNLRLLSERGCIFVQRQAGARGYHDVVRRMYQLKGKSEAGSLFVDSPRVEAVVQIAASVNSDLFTLENDGELVAAILTFVDGNVCRFYGTYYDARWAVFSPGITLLYKVIRQAQQQGLDFDFMTGEQLYKLRFATQVVPLFIAERRATVSLAA